MTCCQKPRVCSAQWKERIDELKGVVLGSQEEIERLQAERQTALEQLVAAGQLLQTSPSEGGGGSSEEGLTLRLQSFTRHLKNQLRKHELDQVEACLDAMVFAVQSQYHEKQLQRALSNAEGLQTQSLSANRGGEAEAYAFTHRDNARVRTFPLSKAAPLP